MASDRRPVVRAPEAAWQRLGELLQLRRAELGYQRRPAFTREHGINIRLVTDIENAYRPNTFLTPTLREIAQAYWVSYDSLIAVLLGHDDELIAEMPSAAPGTDWFPPFRDPARIAAGLPYYTRIQQRLRYLASPEGGGIASPSGAQVFGAGTQDAQTWDGTAGRWEEDQRMWMIADMQRRADGRGGNAGTGAAGA